MKGWAGTTVLLVVLAALGVGCRQPRTGGERLMSVRFVASARVGGAEDDTLYVSVAAFNEGRHRRTLEIGCGQAYARLTTLGSPPRSWDYAALETQRHPVYQDVITRRQVVTVGCSSAAAINLPPRRSAPSSRLAVPVKDVLGDSLPPGRYRVTVPGMMRRTEIEILDAGIVELRRPRIAAVRPDPPGPRPILFQSQAAGNTEDIWTLDPETGRRTLLVRGDHESARGVATWDPSARYAAYVHAYGSRDELWILGPDHQLERHLGPSARIPRHIMFPDWSPDARYLAISAGDSSEHPGVYLVHVPTGRVRQLRKDASSYRCPSWSPRGDQLVVAAYQNAKSALIVIDTLGTVVDTLLRSDSTYLDCPQWSPRGDEILFTVFHDDPHSGWERPAFHSNLAVLSLATRGVRQITHDAGLTNYGRWSSDAEWIVFQSDRAFPPTTDPAGQAQVLQNLDIYLMRRDGTGARRLTENTFFDAHPSW